MTIRGNPDFSSLLYFIGKQFTGISFDLIWRREVRGRENIPPHGAGVIFAANHRSLADPNLVGSAVPYPIHYFAKEELFKVPLLGWYIRKVNAFPVRRSAHDVGAFKKAKTLLELGEGLLLFPEGTRPRTEEKRWAIKPGLGLLACQTGKAVVPVGVRNSENFTKLGKVRVWFGAPMPPPVGRGREAYQEFSDRVMRRIRELVEAP